MTSKPFTTCLWFDNQGEAAARFYTSIFKDSAITSVTRYTEVGPGQAGTVMTVEFTLNGQGFLALNGGPQYTFSPAVSLVVEAADQAEVDYYWDRLTEGRGSGRLRLGHRQVRPELAGRSHRLLRHDARPGPGKGRSRHRRHVAHEEVRRQ